MNEDLYYYSGGKRIALEFDTKHVAIDLDRIESTALREEIEAVLEETEETGKTTRLRRKLHLAYKKDVRQGLRTRLEKTGALQPVFRHGRTLMVALPEVRIEVEKRKEGSSIEQMFGNEGPDVEIVNDQGNRLTIRPMTGSGLDALRLANEVEETTQPLMAQARFVRVVPKPG